MESALDQATMNWVLVSLLALLASPAFAEDSPNRTNVVQFVPKAKKTSCESASEGKDTSRKDRGTAELLEIPGREIAKPDPSGATVDFNRYKIADGSDEMSMRWGSLHSGRATIQYTIRTMQLNGKEQTVLQILSHKIDPKFQDRTLFQYHKESIEQLQSTIGPLYHSHGNTPGGFGGYYELILDAMVHKLVEFYPGVPLIAFPYSYDSTHRYGALNSAYFAAMRFANLTSDDETMSGPPAERDISNEQRLMLFRRLDVSPYTGVQPPTTGRIFSAVSLSDHLPKSFFLNFGKVSFILEAKSENELRLKVEGVNVKTYATPQISFEIGQTSMRAPINKDITWLRINWMTTPTLFERDSQEQILIDQLEEALIRVAVAVHPFVNSVAYPVIRTSNSVVDSSIYSDTLTDMGFIAQPAAHEPFAQSGELTYRVFERPTDSSDQ